jgi:hypothetical protein
MGRPAVIAALALSAGWGKSPKERLVLRCLVRDVVAASLTEEEVLRFLERIRQEMRPDHPPLDEQIDGMIGRSGVKPRLSIVK